MDKLLYIIDKDCAQANPHKVDFSWIDLPGGKALMSVVFQDEQHQERFEKTASAEPVAADDEPVSDAHAAQLVHLGVQSGHTHKQIRKLIKKVHRLL